MVPSRWIRGGTRLLALAGGGLLVTVAIACTRNDPPQRRCSREIWAEPEVPGAPLRVIGSWDGWQRPGRSMAPATAPWQRLEIDDLPPGEYGYLLVEGEDLRRDPRSPLSLFWPRTALGITGEIAGEIAGEVAGGAEADEDLEVSRLEIEDCSVPSLVIDAVDVDDARGELAVAARFLAAEDGEGLARSRVQAEVDGVAITVVADPATGAIDVVAAGLARGKHSIVLRAAAAEGSEATARAVGWVRPEAAGWEGGTLYQVVLDRYRGDGGAPLGPPADPGARAGGTLDGVRAAIEDGTLARLGVSALWLSPVYLGPEEARRGRDDDYLYTNYHGYWVKEGRAVEPAIGGEEALRALIASAHAHGLRILFDIVPNHIYEDNPWAAELAARGGINRREPLCICGAADCPWHEYIGTCWFTDYLPDLRLKESWVLAQVVADALWWSDTFDLDGLRLDAVPMMPRAATRRIAAAIRGSVSPREATFMIGEVFTGPGAWGIDAIRYYLGPDGIDSVFDFPLMWTIREVLAAERVGFEEIDAMLAATEEAIAGSGAVLGRFIGNHDVTRFASEAAGDLEGGASPWESPPPQPSDPAVYERQGLALGLTLMLPGLAVLYYGDEVGLAGAGDPDCRRVMPAEEALLPAQRALRAQTERLGRLRRCLPAFAVDRRETLLAAGDHYAFVRDVGDGEPAVVVLNRGDAATRLTIDLGDHGDRAGEFIDILRGERLLFSGGEQEIEMPPRSIRALIPVTSPCATEP